MSRYPPRGWRVVTGGPRGGKSEGVVHTGTTSTGGREVVAITGRVVTRRGRSSSVANRRGHHAWEGARRGDRREEAVSVIGVSSEGMREGSRHHEEAYRR